MKLLVITNNNHLDKIDFKDFDIILCKYDSALIPEHKKRSIYTYPVNRKESINSYEKQFDKFYDQLEEGIKKEIVYSFKVSFYRAIIEDLSVWESALVGIINEYNISSIFVDQSYTYSNYVPYYGALGEINKELLYSDTDLIPNVVLQIARTHKIPYHSLKRKNNLALFSRIFIRRYGLLLFKFAKHFFIHFKYNQSNIKSSLTKVNPSHKFYIISTRSIVHTDFIRNFLNTLDGNYILITGERLYAYGQNYAFCIKNKINNLLTEKSLLKISDYFTVLIKILSLILKDKLKRPPQFLVKTNSFEINLSHALPEIYISYMELYLYHLSIKRLTQEIQTKTNLQGENIIALSTEQLTVYPYWFAKEIKKIKGCSAQVQTTRMSPMEHLDFIFCDLFLFYSEKTCIEFQKLNESLKSKMLFLGYLKSSPTNIKDYKALNNVIYFTQPYEYEFENEILSTLNNETNIHVSLKLHPRDDESRFNQFHNLSIIEKEKPFDQYIRDFDLAITRVSSVGLECILFGIPTVYCLHSESAKKVTADYIDTSYEEGISYTIADLKTRLTNYESLASSFRQFRKKFMKENSYEFNFSEFERQMCLKNHYKN